MTIEETNRILAVLKAAYPSHPVFEQTPTAYQMALDDLTYETAMGAVQTHLRTSRFFPAPSELLAIVADAAAALDPWEDAWQEVIDTRRAHGSYIGPRWGNDGGVWSSDLIASAVQHVGGYEAICLVELDREPTLRAQFRDFYQRNRDAAVKRIQIGGAAFPWSSSPTLPEEAHATVD